MPCIIEFGQQGVGSVAIDVEERHARTLMREGLHEGAADAGGATGNQYRAVQQTGVAGIVGCFVHGIHHSATLWSGCLQIGLRQRCPTLARSVT
jgi:hypothetical protein